VTQARAFNSAEEEDIEAERIEARINPTTPTGKKFMTKLKKKKKYISPPDHPWRRHNPSLRTGRAFSRYLSSLRLSE
jgi:hypothetical protein